MYFYDAFSEDLSSFHQKHTVKEVLLTCVNSLSMPCNEKSFKEEGEIFKQNGKSF